MKKQVKSIVAISILIFGILLIQLVAQYPPLSLAVDFDKLADFGTAIGGIFAFISIYILYVTLRAQMKFSKQQSNAFNLSQFESRLFELIRYHRDNVAITRMRAPDKVTEVYYDGHKAMREIHKQMIKVINIIKPIINKTADYKLKEPLNSNLDIIAERINVDASKLDLYNISYLCLFFGMSTESQKTLRTHLEARYTETFIKSVISRLSRVDAAWQRTNSEIDGKRRKKTKYFGGHQYRLGHYFRHLYQIVTYVDNNDSLSFQQKYEYIKILRAQLSTYEQTLIFFNSIGDLGRGWELQVDTSSIPSSKEQEYLIYKGLITKYNLVRNIPNEFITNISVNEIYPNITFEAVSMSEDKTKHLDIYSKKTPYFQLN